MSILSNVEAKLPPGFRFHPTDEELILDYLALNVDTDLYKCIEPWYFPVRTIIQERRLEKEIKDVLLHGPSGEHSCYDEKKWRKRSDKASRPKVIPSSKSYVPMNRPPRRSMPRKM